MSEHPERAELSAWMDREIPVDRARRIEAHIGACEHCASIVAAYRANDRAARDLFARLADESPERPAERVLERARASRVRQRRTGAAAATVAALALAATLLSGLLRPTQSPSAPATLAHSAIQAHALYAPDPSRADAATQSPGGLAGWLSDALGRPLGTPGLERMGYRLVDARRVPANPGPAAVLQYRGPDGHRITCYFAKRPGNTDAGMRYLRDKSVGAFYSVDDGLAYAVVGDIGRAALRTIAREAYESIERGYAAGPRGG